MRIAMIVLAMAGLAIGQTTKPIDGLQMSAEQVAQWQALHATRRDEDIRVENDRLMRENSDLQRQVAALKLRLSKYLQAEKDEAAKLVAADAASGEPIQRGLKEGKLVVGMTLDQAKRALKKNGWTEPMWDGSHTEGQERYIWSTSGAEYSPAHGVTSVPIRKIIGDFKDGKLVFFSKD